MVKMMKIMTEATQMVSGEIASPLARNDKERGSPVTKAVDE